jgi:hypothetical protein
MRGDTSAVKLSVICDLSLPESVAICVNLCQKKYLNTPNKPNSMEPSVKTLNDLIRDNQPNPDFQTSFSSVCSVATNFFSQNKPNFQNWQNALTPFLIEGCPKPTAGSGPKNKPKQSQFPNRLTANC